MIGPPLCMCEFIWTLISSINSSLHMEKTIAYMFLVKMVWIGSLGECNLCLDNGWYWGFTVLTVSLEHYISCLHSWIKNVWLVFILRSKVPQVCAFMVLVPLRFPNALGAFMYPIYGQGELPQAFCRRAAVKGCIHVCSSQGIHNLVF